MKRINGDAVELFKNHVGDAILIHQVNCQGKMGSGIAKQIREEFPEHYDDYKSMCIEIEPEELLGMECCTGVGGNPDKAISGIFGQLNYGYDGGRYTNYSALFLGLNLAVELGSDLTGVTFYVPEGLGCGLGGGDWNFVLNFLMDMEVMYNMEFTVVTYNK